MAADDDTLQALIARVALGDAQAFEQLYELSAPRLLGVAMSLLGRRERAEEAVQEAFFKIWQRADSYSVTAGPPFAWLAAVVRHQALDLLRSERRRPLEFGDEEHVASLAERADERPDPLDLLEQAIDALRLHNCLQAVPQQQRRCLALAYYRGLTHTQLADQLAAPIGSVKVWLRRGLDHLRRCLDAVA